MADQKGDGMETQIKELLKNEFSKRRIRNQNYSLRSFSRDLDIDPSNLSKFLNGKRPLSQANIKKVASVLGLAELMISKQPSQIEFNKHDLSVFQIISEWQHYAILELFNLTNFKPNSANIAQSLEISLPEVERSISRLKQVGLLAQDAKSDQLKPLDQNSSSITEVPTSKAHRSQQRQILEGAIKAIETIPIDLRSQTSLTLAINSKKINEAKKLIETFRRQLGEFLSAGNDLDEVYQFSISLYPVTNNFKNKNPKKRGKL